MPGTMIDSMQMRLTTGEAVRVTEDAVPAITGYAAVFNVQTPGPVGWGGEREILRPGAFRRSLERVTRGEADVRALFMHDRRELLARTRSGTLSLREDEHGLLVRFTPPATTLGRDVLELVRRGDLDSWSFGFFDVPDGVRTTQAPGKDPVREVVDLELGEVSIVDDGAYGEAVEGIHLNASRRHSSQSARPKVADLPASLLRAMARLAAARR